MFGMRVSRFGCLFPPIHRLAAILRNAATFVIHHADIKLRACIALLRQRRPTCQRTAEIAALISLPSRFKCRRGQSRRCRYQRRNKHGHSQEGACAPRKTEARPPRHAGNSAAAEFVLAGAFAIYGLISHLTHAPRAENLSTRRRSISINPFNP